MAVFRYNVKERTRQLSEIRRLLIEEGLNYSQIMQRLNLPKRTFYRYLWILFQDDNRLLADTVSDEEILNQMSICKDRLIQQRNDILSQIANNSEADWNARIAGHHLCGEIATLIVKMHIQAPAMLAQRHRFPDTASLPLAERQGTSGIKLVLKNGNNGKKQQHQYYQQHEHEQEQGETSEGGAN